MDIGNNLKRQSLDVDADMLARGLKDAMSGGETLLSDEEARETLAALQQELREKALERRKQDAEKRNNFV